MLLLPADTYTFFTVYILLLQQKLFQSFQATTLGALCVTYPHEVQDIPPWLLYRMKYMVPGCLYH